MTVFRGVLPATIGNLLSLETLYDDRLSDIQQESFRNVPLCYYSMISIFPMPPLFVRMSCSDLCEVKILLLYLGS